MKASHSVQDISHWKNSESTTRAFTAKASFRILLPDDKIKSRGECININQNNTVAKKCCGEKLSNFLLKNNKGDKFVLKIANEAESAEVLDFQNQVMEHMAKQDPSLPLPKVCLSLDKKQIHRLELNGNKHFVRVVTYLKGKLLGDLPQDKRDQNLMIGMGQVFRQA